MPRRAKTFTAIVAKMAAKIAATTGAAIVAMCCSVWLTASAHAAEPAATPATPAAQEAQQSEPHAEMITTPSGLQYEDVKVGSGDAVKIGTRVKVYYTGWLQTAQGRVGPIFDTNQDGNSEPLRFMVGMGRVIPGWDEGLQGMRVGGVRIMIIPPDLAYGERGAGRSIPPNSTLIFKVELIDAQR